MVSVIEVAIGPGGVPGMFRVQVVASPAGEASAAVELDADALLARRGLLQQAVLASAVPSRQVLPETEQPVREAGELLFAGLLGTGEVAGRYRAAAAVAAERGEGLRVVLRIDTPSLAGLPWEAMYDRAAGVYVCRQDQLVRHVPVASVPAPLQVRPPLRILGVVSSPRGLPPLDVDKEQDQLARALARPASQGLAEVHWAPSATWADLQDLLLDGEWHVLHFIGHGDFDPGRDEGVLALVREDRRADLVAAHRLVDLLRQARPMPRLVVLNSCSGAAAGIGDLFSGTAAAMVRGGVSAVAAMQYEISDPAAVAFARGFYAAIARGRGIDDAVSSGRVAILGTGDRTLEWVTPVLYLRGHDARLFTFPASAEDTNREGAGSVRGGQPERQAQEDAERQARDRAMKVAARPALERLRVFVASPGDVAAEREHVKAVADELNRGIAVQAGFVLEVVRWETHAHPDMGRAEQLILDQIGQYDLFVGIMWRRFGTPTGVAGSGTEEEFDHALRAWQQSGQPRLLCYFSRAPGEPPETVDEATQLLKVTQFRSQVETKGLAWRYRSDADFKDLLREHLQRILWEFAGRRPALDRNLLTLPDADLPLSPEVVVPRQLPPAVAGFAGRAGELEALTSLLEEAALPGGTVVISAIDGTAGIGKTALAVQWAYQWL